jgi:Subtilase family/S-layer homology domain
MPLQAIVGRFSARWARLAVASVLSLGLCYATGAAAQSTQMSDQAASQIRALLAEKESRNAAQQKIDSQLLYTSRMARGMEAAPGVATLDTGIPVDAKGMVEVDIRAAVGSGVEQLVRSVGGTVVRTFAFANSIEARVPVDQLETIAGDKRVTFIMPKAQAMLQSAGRPPGAGEMEAPTLSPRLQRFKNTVEAAVEAAKQKSGGGVVINAGSVTSQGDKTHRAEDVRNTLLFNGAGMCVGVLSDSFNSLGAAPTDVTNGDLPGTGTPFPFSKPVGFAGSGDITGASDEGRAMIQIVHDLVPAARIYFATAFNSMADFANNIRALRGISPNPGGFGNVFPKCDIIVDDVFYYIESGLHDGQPGPSSGNIAQVSQAVNDVVNDGGMYFSSAGNSGNTTQVRPSTGSNTSGAWEGDYVGGVPPAPLLTYADALLWDGVTTLNNVAAAGTWQILHWSDPIGASTNDYDFCRLNSTGTAIVSCSTNIQNGSQDPLEFLTGTPSANQKMVVVRKAGAAPRFMSVTMNRGRLSINTTGQTRGHGASPLAMGVAATPAATAFGLPTPNGPYPSPFIGTNQIEYFSSDGPRRSFFNADGSAVTPGNFLAGSNGGIVRTKPDMTAADGVSTTLPGGSGLNPFYGTSAAAPHAGAIAALIKQGIPNATPAQVTNIMKSTALDIMAAGADKDSGAGIVQAFQAVQAAGGTLGAMVRPTAVNVVPFGNTTIEPNECNTLSIPLINEGPAGATAVSSTIATTTPGVEVTVKTSAYPNLAANGGNAANTTAFEVTTSKSVCFTTATFTQTVNFSGGVAPRNYSFMLPVGAPAQYTFTPQPSVGLPGGATGPLPVADPDEGIADITVPAGFSFMVYDKVVAGGSKIQADTNGNVQILPSGGAPAYFNTALPSGQFELVPVVFPYWDDLDVGVTGGGIYTNFVGSAPNRQLIVEWRGKRFGEGSTTVTLNFGVLFNENSSVIEFRYPSTATTSSPNGASATVGVQNGARAGQFTQHSFNQAVITSGLVLRGTLSGGCAAAATGQCSTSLFADVTAANVGVRQINTVYNHIPRITNGCTASPLNYCPATPITREQMAAYVIRAKEGNPATDLCAGGSPFTDVSPSSPFCSHIARMLQLGITTGCNATGPQYCPIGLVSRESMAAFLVRAVEGDPATNLCTVGGSPFTDVPASSPFCPHIKRAQQLGITSGCTATTYCPAQIVNREQMAIFLVNAFGL